MSENCFRNYIEMMLQPGLQAIRNSARGINLHDGISDSGDEFQLYPDRSLNMFTPTIEADDEKATFGQMIYGAFDKYTKTIRKSAVKAFSWSYDQDTQSFEEEKLDKTSRINSRWKFGLYERKCQELEDCSDHSLFIPNIGILDVKDGYIIRALTQVAEQMSNFTEDQQADGKNAEFQWQQMLSDRPAISGFGVDGCQLYIKSGLTVTLFHDELGWSTATNYMTRASRGIALWVGVNLKQLEPHFTKSEMVEWFNQANLNEFLIRLANLRNELYLDNVQKQDIPEITIAWQTPGSMVYSPSNGCGHVVLTCADYVEQLAMNFSASEQSIRECLKFWKDFQNTGIEYNSGMATEHVIPCVWLRAEHNLMLGDAIESRFNALLPYIHDMEHKTSIEYVNATNNLTCSKCENPVLWALFDDKCENCFLHTNTSVNEEKN